VAELIRATKHSVSDSNDADTALLLDADLAILGASPERYRDNADAIRREYSWVDEAAYRSGRGEVLGSFLRRDRIYRTERMAELREEFARSNLRAEITRLRS
jgi:predicted metal-dependent HD superfamily phosphohydrolase